VLDSNSDDRTEEICKSLGVKFYKQDFLGYIDQKNKAFELAENDFILSLDADEEISGRLINSIQGIKEKPECDAYCFNRLNIYCGKKIRTTSWYPDRKLRLWNRQKGRWQGSNLHEVVVLEPKSIEGFLKGDLYHYSYQSISQHIAQTNKFTDIAANSMYERGKKSSVFKIIYKSFFAFIREYFIKRAIFGGFSGFIVAYINVFYVFLKYSKLLSLQKSKPIKN